MTIAIMVILNLVMWAIGAGVLAGALLLTGEELTKDVLLKCLGISCVAIAVSYIPTFGFMSGIAWLVAIMVVFEKTFVEAVIVALVCWVINIVVGLGVGLLIGPFV